MKKPKETSCLVLILAIVGILLFISGMINENWFHFLGGIFLMLNGEITIINYDGRETDK